ncbi:hypothetical protein B0H63DRAFT_512098 [Podospora didyma]|uniref:Uncharacterized protein n=1 Tax=Podospora didyma TaxID=330526 RepID=A0AAE0NBH6_9PEZI|nr:hypothetical protein B0H63DRAFT_512098 [Podospora didyma]
MEDGLDSGLFGISLSDSEPEEGNYTCAPEGTNTSGAANETTSTTTASKPTRADRTALSEPTFQALQATYRPKHENGEIWKTIPSPNVSETSNAKKANKPETQEILHAVEELYFFKRYDEAVAFVERILAGSSGSGEEWLDEETRTLLRHYEGRCRAKKAAASMQGDS